MSEKEFDILQIKPTVLSPLYARAWASRQKSPEFIDEVAINLIDKLDYNYKKCNLSKLDKYAYASKTIIIDNIVIEYIKKFPNSTIVNLASGLDDRFSRVDNGLIEWYNIDLQEIIVLRNRLIKDNIRVKNLAYDIFDYKWMSEIKNKDNVLFIFEGILMYVKEYEAKALFNKIAINFAKSTLIVELMSDWVIKHQKVKNIDIVNDNIYSWGVKDFKCIESMTNKFRYIKDFNLTDYMKLYSPIRINLLYLYLKNKNNRIVVYKHKQKELN